jgi:hypothetical protein
MYSKVFSKYITKSITRNMITVTPNLIGFNLNSQCPYEVLGVQKDATNEQLKEAYTRIRLYSANFGSNPKIVYAYKFAVSNLNDKSDLVLPEIIENEILNKNISNQSCKKENELDEILKPTENKKWKYENVIITTVLCGTIISYELISEKYKK